MEQINITKGHINGAHSSKQANIQYENYRRNIRIHRMELEKLGNELTKLKEY